MIRSKEYQAWQWHHDIKIMKSWNNDMDFMIFTPCWHDIDNRTSCQHDNTTKCHHNDIMTSGLDQPTFDYCFYWQLQILSESLLCCYWFNQYYEYLHIYLLIWIWLYLSLLWIFILICAGMWLAVERRLHWKLQSHVSCVMVMDSIEGSGRTLNML